MVKKAFYAFTVLLVLLFIVLGFFRVQASFEFRALEFREEGASLEKYTRLSEIWKLLYKIIPYLCAVHPFFALAVWLTCQGSFKTTAIPTLLAAAVIAALVVWCHRENIQRLVRGEERKFRWHTGPVKDE